MMSAVGPSRYFAAPNNNVDIGVWPFDFLAAVVAPIGNGFEFVDAENFLRLASDVGELRPIRAVVRYLMCDDQVMNWARRRSTFPRVKFLSRVLKEVGNRLVVRNEPAGQPHTSTLRPASRSSRRLD